MLKQNVAPVNAKLSMLLMCDLMMMAMISKMLVRGTLQLQQAPANAKFGIHGRFMLLMMSGVCLFGALCNLCMSNACLLIPRRLTRWETAPFRHHRGKDAILPLLQIGAGAPSISIQLAGQVSQGSCRNAVEPLQSNAPAERLHEEPQRMHDLCMPDPRGLWSASKEICLVGSAIDAHSLNRGADSGMQTVP